MANFALKTLVAASAAGAVFTVAAPATITQAQTKRPVQVAQARMVSIPMTTVTAAIRTAFAGTRIRLNNFGSVRNPFVQNGSFITLGPVLGGRSVRFTIFPFFKRRSRHYYYISDVNLRSFSVAQQRGLVRLSFTFEEGGVELKGICRSGFGGCPGGRDGHTPDVQISNIRVDVLLEPWAVNGSVGYRRAFVRFHGRSQARGICHLPGDPCNVLTRYKSKIRENVERGLQAVLHRADVRARLAAALRPILRARGVGRVFFAQIRGRELQVFHRPSPRT